MWPTYPQIGIDDRNQFDFFRSMPGGLDVRGGVLILGPLGLALHALPPLLRARTRPEVR